jgi:hypothetical protein
MGKGQVSIGILLCADPAFLGRQAFVDGNGSCVHAFLCYYLYVLTPPHTVLRRRPKCARIHSRLHGFADVFTATIVVALLSYFFIHDVGVFVFHECFC